MATQTATATTISTQQRLLTGVVALALGLFMLIGVGFAGSTVLHNAAHDTRHSIGFPCH
ncbi:MAG: CbtB domain-containing protein [Parvibaculaceae bacterium]